MKINGEKLRKKRESHCLTIKDIALRVGVSISTIGMYERGERSPDDVMAKKLADLFDEDITFFSEETDESVLENIRRIDTYSMKMKEFGFQRSNGYCEFCDKYAPFVTGEGEPYLEMKEIQLDKKRMIYPMLCPNCKCRLEKIGTVSDAKYLEKKCIHKVGTPLSSELRDNLVFVLTEIQDNFAQKSILYAAFTYIRDILVKFKYELSKREFDQLLNIYLFGLENAEFHNNENKWIDENFEFVANFCRVNDPWRDKFLSKDFNYKSIIKLTKEIKESQDVEFLLTVPHYVLQTEVKYKVENDVMQVYAEGIFKDILLGKFR